MESSTATSNQATCWSTSWQAVRATRAEREQIQLRTDAVTALKALRGDKPSLKVDFASNSNALVEIEQALQRWPDQPRLWANQAFLLEQVGRLDDASRGITRAIQLLETLERIFAPLRCHVGQPTT
jgi:Flp pilus assembly protein TadD